MKNLLFNIESKENGYNKIWDLMLKASTRFVTLL